PKHLDVPEQLIQALFLTTCRVMETEFRAPGALANRFRVKLVLGQPPDRFTIDDVFGNGTVYLENWNEGKFTISTMRLAMQRLLSPDRQQKMMQEIARRAHEIAPVSAHRLDGEHVPPVALEVQDTCSASMKNASVRAANCKPNVMVPRRSPAPVPW